MKKIFTLFFILSCFFTSFGAYLENILLQLTQPNSVTITQNANLEEDCALFEDIEHSAWGGTGNGSYANRTVTDDLGTWSVSAVTNVTAGSDRFLDARSARFRGNASDSVNLNRVEMLFDKPNGLGTVSFF